MKDYSMNFKNKQKKFKKLLKKSMVIDCFVLLLTIIALLIPNLEFPLYFFILIIICFVLEITMGTCFIVYLNKETNDIEKNEIFLVNEDLINEKVKSNENILSRTNSKTKELVSSTPKDKPVFNLNDIDNKYIRLKKAIENIKRDEQFEPNYSSVQKEEPVQLTKKKKIIQDNFE